MTESFNLDAIKVEDEDQPPFEFDYQGEHFTMSVANAMPWQDQLALETATALQSLRLIMGAKQFKRFERLRMSAARLGVLLEEWSRYQGLEPGEFPASSGSFGSTAGLSKPTSPGTTT